MNHEMKQPPVKPEGRWVWRRFTDDEALRFAEWLFSHGRELGVWPKRKKDNHGKLLDSEF